METGCAFQVRVWRVWRLAVLELGFRHFSLGYGHGQLFDRVSYSGVLCFWMVDMELRVEGLGFSSLRSAEKGFRSNLQKGFGRFFFGKGFATPRNSGFNGFNSGLGER